MAIKYYERYPQRWESPSQDYPQGAFKNLSALGEQDGSYLEKDWLNDKSGFFGALLRNAEMTPDGTIDTAQRSQFYDALIKVAKSAVADQGYATKTYVDNKFNEVPKTEVINDWDQASDENTASSHLVYMDISKLKNDISSKLEALTSDKIFFVPSDYPTLQKAYDYIISKYVSSGGVATIIVEDGHLVKNGLEVNSAFASFITVTSPNKIIKLSPEFKGRFINAISSYAPKLDAFIDGSLTSSLDRAYSLINSLGSITAGSGCSNSKGRPLYCNNSIVTASNTVWENCADQMYFSAGSSAQLGGSIIKGFTVSTNGSLTVSRGSSVEAQNLVIEDCVNGIELKRAGSSLNAHGCKITNIENFVCRLTRGASASLDGGVITGCKSNGFEVYGGRLSFAEGSSITATDDNKGIGVLANSASIVNMSGVKLSSFGTNLSVLDGANVSAPGSSLLNAKTHGVVAYRGGSVSLDNATVTGSAGNDLRVTQGGVIYASRVTTSNGSGSPALTDTNLDGFGGFNSVSTSGRGIIWA